MSIGPNWKKPVSDQADYNSKNTAKDLRVVKQNKKLYQIITTRAYKIAVLVSFTTHMNLIANK